MITAIVGANWGDECKGKITDALSIDTDVVVRYQGGSNAGHTILCPFGKFALHLLPSGVFHPHIQNVIGPGVALSVPHLMKEWQSLLDRGVPAPNLLISDRAHLVMPYHILFDTYEEERLADRKFGSTKSGIAPFYADKYAKVGFQVSELLGDVQALSDKLAAILEVKNVTLTHLYHKPTLSHAELYKDLLVWREWIAPFVGDTSKFFTEAMRDGKNILLEGQLGALKDTDHGIYPYTTSSSTLAGYAAVGAGLPPYKIERIVAVTKAYSSTVGEGPFVTELFGDEGEELRRRGGDGGEYGATTGRPRRVGWFDAVATRYGVAMQGATEVALTIIDALGYLDELQICVGYEIDGVVTADFPVTSKLKSVRPVYQTLPGWRCDVRDVTRYSALPKNCRDYIEFIETCLGVPIRLVSNGPFRENLIVR